MTSVLSAPHFHNVDAARARLEEIVWPQGPFCPRCGGFERITDVKGGRPGLRRCGPCKREFTVTVGTIFERSKVPLNKWFQAAHLMASSKKGVSAHQMHRAMEITYKAAWFMCHRLREAMRTGGLVPFGGEGKVIEADETYFGSVKRPRVRRMDGRPFKGSAMGRGPANKRAIISLVERGGSVRSFHVPRADRVTVEKIVSQNVARESRLHTDESHLYAKSKVPSMVAKHEAVKHSAEEYVRGDVHSNSVEGYFSVFKRGMRGTYQHCSEKHLHRYLAEFDFRYNNRSALGVEDMERTDALLSGISGKRMTCRRVNV